MTPLARLLAEEWPDGRFGGPRPANTSPSPAPCHDEAAAQHYADLEAALCRRAPRRTARHRADLTAAPRKDQP